MLFGLFLQVVGVLIVCVANALSNARNVVPPQSVPLLLQTFQFLHTLVDPTAGPPDFVIRQLVRQYLEDTPLPSFATAGVEAPSSAPGPSVVPLKLTASSVRNGGTENLVASGSEKQPECEADGEGEGTASEVGELLMHMSLADNGQVSCD